MTLTMLIKKWLKVEGKKLTTNIYDALLMVIRKINYLLFFLQRLLHCSTKIKEVFFDTTGVAFQPQPISQ